MIGRFAEQRLRDAVADTPVVLVHGPRQVGKSTLAQKVAREIGATEVTLDDLASLELATRNPEAFLKNHPTPLLIDEVQRAPGLMLAIKAEVDRQRGPGRFLLTGSANVLTLPKVADSLAGRMEVIDLWPLSQAEIHGRDAKFVDLAFDGNPQLGSSFDLADSLQKGGFPEPLSRSALKRREAWYQSYVRTLLERDVRDLAQIDGLTQLPRLLRTLASRTGQTLNLASLSRETGIPATTVDRYVDLLKALFLIIFLPPWSQEAGQAFVKSPRVFMVDSGLLLHLTQGEANLNDPFVLQPILRNLVALELISGASESDYSPVVRHLRTVRQKEVDFVIERRDGSVVGIHVEAEAAVHPNSAEGLRFLKELAPERFTKGIVLYLGDRRVVLDDKIEAWPISALVS